MGEVGVSFHVGRRGMRNEADTWVEGKAYIQGWGVHGGRQVCELQTSTRHTRSERGMGEFGVRFHVCRRGMRNEADTWVEGEGVYSGVGRTRRTLSLRPAN